MGVYKEGKNWKVQGAALSQKEKSTKAISLQRRKSGLRAKHLPEKSKKCSRRSSTAM